VVSKESTIHLVSAIDVLDAMLNVDSSLTVALHPTDRIIVPTNSATQTITSTAVPASSALSEQAPETSRIQPPANPHPSAASSSPPKDPSTGSTHVVDDQAPEQTPKTAGGSGGNVWPLFVSDFEPPDKTDALSVLKSALASMEAAQATVPQDPNSSQYQSTGQQKHPENGNREGLSGTNDPKESTDNAMDESSMSEQVAAVWNYKGDLFTAVLTGGSAFIHGGGNAATLVPDRVATLKGQTFSMPPDGDIIKVDASILTFDRIALSANNAQAGDQVTAVFTVSDQTFTAIGRGSSAVLQAAGSATTIAHGAEAIFAGQKVAFPSSGCNVLDVNDAIITMQALAGSSNDLGSVASAVWTQSQQAFTAKMEHGSVLLLQAPGTSVRMRAGSITTIGDTVYSVPSVGGILVHDGTSVTLAHDVSVHPATLTATSTGDKSRISAFKTGESVVLVVGDETLTLAAGAQTSFGGHVISAASREGELVVDGSSAMSISASESHAPSSENANGGGSVENSFPTTTISNLADRKALPALGSVGLMFLVCGVIFYLYLA